MIEGNVINAEKLDKINEASGDKHGGIMPQSRMLIRRTADGSEEIINVVQITVLVLTDVEIIIIFVRNNFRH